MSKLAELIAGSRRPIGHAPARLRETPVTLDRARLLELEALLHLRDGFVTLAGAVMVRPSVTVASIRGIPAWNEISLWRAPYPRSSELLFFGETLTGQCFALHRDQVVHFDPRSGLLDTLGFSLERWAQQILSEPAAWGQELARTWAANNRPLEPNERLQPSDPFAEIDDPAVEYRVTSDVELMRHYANVFRSRAGSEPGPSSDDGWVPTA